MKPYLGIGRVVRTKKEAREDERRREEAFDRAMAGLKKYAHGT